MNDLRDVEIAILEVLKTMYSQTVFDLWFRDIRLEQMTDQYATFSINSTFKQGILQNRHSPALTKALEEVTGFPMKVIISLRNDDPPAPPPDAPTEPQQEPAEPEVDIQKEEDPAPPTVSKDDFGAAIQGRAIVTEYTFDNFIVGDSNKFAHAACLAVAKSPTTYNPLFIHGPSGLGKTHLLYAVTNELKASNPNIRLIYKKGEEFTNELIESIQKGTTVSFREKYRTADVLLIDDIQFIAGKESTQEEFFHTFNALYEAEKQIILTSDRPPRDIKTLEDRLSSRFEWGLIADIQPPSQELRQAIIQKKAEEQGISLSPEIVAYLAENLQTNIRQIEGSIKKISAISRLTGIPVSLDMTKRAISDILSGAEPVSVTVNKILSAVSKYYSVSIEDIKGIKRSKNIVNARHVAVYLIRSITSLPVTAIGDIFERDHATILASINKIKNDLKTDKELQTAIETITTQVKT
ncbi:MAG: chromosomal replication initiator protein DnaA [Clostridia bacterium]|nr:chromosomal replication initiator protein DnaA [Clostridia bacterium]